MMNAYRDTRITFLSLLLISVPSCDNAPGASVTPMATADPVGAGPISDLAAASGDEPVHNFQIDIGLINEDAHALRSRVHLAADRWARIVRGTDLEDIAWEPGTVSCGGLEYDYPNDVLDDLFVMIDVQDFDGGPGAGVRSTVCGYRYPSMLPMIGAIIVDNGERAPEAADELLLHGFGHMLGISGSWKMLDLLRNPSSEDEGADTHFVGERAIAAFVAAGGASYQGAKVPVENSRTYGTPDGHWRESVFDTELMTSLLQVGADPISAITIQSLADIGYTVDVELSDVYLLPSSSMAAARAAEGSPAIDLSGDVVEGPAVLYDRQGRVVRVIRR